MATKQPIAVATFFAALLAGACFPAPNASAADAAPRTVKASPSPQGPKWGAHLDLEGKWGNRRSLGDVGLFSPLWQSPTSLFFTDIRGRLDDRDSREGNFGLGLRHMLPSGWNAGIYGYYDARRTGRGNLFQQATLGAELLSADFDLRVNGYLPFGTKERVIGIGGPGGASFADFTNGTIEIVTPGSGQIVERAMRGFDGEIGWRLPVFPIESLTQIRAYAGGFWFGGEGLLPDIAGPRGRVELSFEQASGPLAGARLTVGAEVQHDKVRGTNAFAVARLRIPLQPVERFAARLTPQERRMTERVVRDVDIVAGEGKKGVTTETREAAINIYNDEVVTDVVQVDASGGQAQLQNELNNRPSGSIVILNGALTGLNTNTSVGEAKTLLGGGALLPLKGATTGNQATFTAPGAAGSMSGAVGNDNSIIVNDSANKTVVGGLTIENTGANGAYGIYIYSQTGAAASGTIFGNTISAADGRAIFVHVFDNAKVLNNTVTTASRGIYFDTSTGGLVQGNTVTTNSLNAAGVELSNADNISVFSNAIKTLSAGSYGIRFNTSDNGTAFGNNISSTGAQGIYFQNSNNVAATSNSIQSSGAGSGGIIANGSTNVTIANNTFGPAIISTLVTGMGGSTFVTADSTGNIDASSGVQHCSGDNTASGTVAFTTGANCNFP